MISIPHSPSHDSHCFLHHASILHQVSAVAVAPITRLHVSFCFRERYPESPSSKSEPEHLNPKQHPRTQTPSSAASCRSDPASRASCFVLHFLSSATTSPSCTTVSVRTQGFRPSNYRVFDGDILLDLPFGKLGDYATPLRSFHDGCILRSCQIGQAEWRLLCLAPGA